jgi:hypothetical protein
VPDDGDHHAADRDENCTEKREDRCCAHGETFFKEESPGESAVRPAVLRTSALGVVAVGVAASPADAERLAPEGAKGAA